MTEEERKENIKNYLSITQVAKYRNVSTDTLRYYDKIGLFKPDYVDPVNERRYYSMEQCEKLGTILELRAMEIPIKDIHEFMQNRTVNKSEEILNIQLSLLNKEIEEKQQLRKVLLDKLEFIKVQKESKVPLDTPLFKNIPERYALFGKEGKLSSKDVVLEYMRLEKSMEGLSPIFATNKMAIEIPVSIHTNLHHETVRPVIFYTGAKKEQKNICKIPGGKYVCMYINDDKGNLEEKIDSIKQYARNEAVEMEEIGFMIYQIDITLTDDREEILIELQFPVKGTDL